MNYFRNLEIFKSERKTLDHLLTITQPSLRPTLVGLPDNHAKIMQNQLFVKNFLKV